MKASDFIWIGLGLGALYLAYTRMQGNAVFVSQASWDKIKADPNRQAWRDPDGTPQPGAPDGEWDSLCGTFSTHFPNACPSGLSQLILIWFKGLNINPVHNQGYANTYATDIRNFLNAKLYEGINPDLMQPGEFILAQGLT